MALARADPSPLARPLIVARTHPRPGGEAGIRTNAAPIRPDLRRNHPCGLRADTRETAELRHLCRQGGREVAHRLVEVRHAPVRQIHEVQDPCMSQA
jgi:hypothetical protein